MTVATSRAVCVVPNPPSGHTLFRLGNVMYAIWEDGRGLWNLHLGRFLEGYIDDDGYKIYAISNRTYKFHRLMLIVFDRTPERGEEGRHLDGNPSNNHISNLCWGTGKDNWMDRRKHGRTKPIKDGVAVRSLLTDEEARRILLDPRETKLVAEEYNVSYKIVTRIKRRLTWRHLKGRIPKLDLRRGITDAQDT